MGWLVVEVVVGLLIKQEEVTADLSNKLSQTIGETMSYCHTVTPYINLMSEKWTH